eukprot:TRINITY_DN62577_c0_g1_i1.p1 TRINITY_DN62577_c0_g1~~TRINITY_DN62577_c0_g1_i1.p1  ORF type:complete len:644 (-),score=92.41 TRINITY_DN62577_c0_g1_i1:27-1934(-)
MSTVNNIFQVFRRWNLNERSAIQLEDLTCVLDRVGKVNQESSSSFFRSVDTDQDGRIDYGDLQRWFLGSTALTGSRLLHRCKCPDGHELSVFQPDVDGWCCEECGEDLEASQTVLRCEECDGVCWCVACGLQTTDVPSIEKVLLAAIPKTAATARVTIASPEPAAVPMAAAVEAAAAVTATLGASTPGDNGAPTSAQLGVADMAMEADRPRKARRTGSLDFMGEGQGTPAEEQYIDSLINQLACKGVDPRLDAISGLSCLVKDNRLAGAVGNHMRALALQLERKGDTSVHNEMLTFLRRLAELGQADGVGLYAYLYAQCLGDDDIVIVRKASMLFAIVAREGSSELLTRYIPNLMDCFERVAFRITAPLEALQAIAEGGNGAAVAPLVQRLEPLLLSLNSRGRSSTCNLFGSVFRGGGGDFVYRASIKDDVKVDEATASQRAPSLLRKLLLIVRDEEDEDVRRHAAQALQQMVLSNEDITSVLRSCHSLIMFNCLGVLQGKHNSEARGIISEILGQDSCRPDASKSNDEEDGPEQCAICFHPGLRCQRGGSKTLPCGHAFHANCVRDWFNWELQCGRGRSCPLCRAVAPAASECNVGSPVHRQRSTTLPVGRQNSVARLRAEVGAARAHAQAQAA